ncbi:MAG: HAMP domain-containing protein, partial [Actinomycetota bacterium]
MRFTRSLRGRLAAYFAISIVITLLISGFLALGLVQRYLQKKTVSDLESQVRALARQIETEGLPARRFIDDLEKMYGTNAVIVPYREQALRQLPRSGNRPQDDIEPGGRQFNFLDWELLKSGGTQTTETELPAVDRDVIVAAHGIRAGGDLAGAVVLSKPVRYLQSWQPLALEFLIAAVPSLAVSFFISFLLARRLSRPLHEITEAATAVATGDFSREVAAGSDDEIGRLADAFRYM